MHTRTFRTLMALSTVLVWTGLTVSGCAAKKGSAEAVNTPPATSANPVAAARESEGSKPSALTPEEAKAASQDSAGEKRTQTDEELARKREQATGQDAVRAKKRIERDVVDFDSAIQNETAVTPVGPPIAVNDLQEAKADTPTKAKVDPSVKAVDPKKSDAGFKPKAENSAAKPQTPVAPLPPPPARPVDPTKTGNTLPPPHEAAAKTAISVKPAEAAKTADAKPAEASKPADVVKPTDAAKPVEPSKSAESQKAVNSPEAAKPADAPKSVDGAKPVENKPKEAPKVAQNTNRMNDGLQLYSSFDLKVCERLSLAARDLTVNMSAVQKFDGDLPAALPFDYYRDLEKSAHERGISMNPVQLRKNHFVCTLLPIVARLNATVFRQRLEIVRVDSREQKGIVSAVERLWMEEIKNRYGLTAKASTAELMRRVDVVPVSLIIAVAAEYTNWGLSAEAKETNNLFGLRERNALKRYQFAVESAGDFIEFMNSASEASYPMLKRFRDARMRLRTEAKPLDALLLSETLEGLPGAKSVDEIKGILRGWSDYSRFELRENELRSN